MNTLWDRMRTKACRQARISGLMLGALALQLSTSSGAVEIGSTQTAATMPAKSTQATSAALPTASIWSANDSTLAQLWRLSVPEVQRARILMQGPRGTFSSPQLSPIEALGIHARTDSERDRYAKLFAQVTYDDTQRVLAWSRVAQGELQALTAGQDVMNFDQAPKAPVSHGAADILGVPRSAVVPPVKRESQGSRPKPPLNKALGRSVDNRGRAGAKPSGAR